MSDFDVGAESERLPRMGAATTVEQWDEREHRLNREEYESWLRHPFTARFFENLGRLKHRLASEHSGAKTAHDLAVNRGRILAINDILVSHADIVADREADIEQLTERQHKANRQAAASRQGEDDSGPLHAPDRQQRRGEAGTSRPSFA